MAVGPVGIPVSVVVPVTDKFPLMLTKPVLPIVNLEVPSVVTVKVPSVPVSVTVAFVLPTEILVFVKVCQLGPAAEPLLISTWLLVP